MTKWFNCQSRHADEGQHPLDKLELFAGDPETSSGGRDGLKKPYYKAVMLTKVSIPWILPILNLNSLLREIPETSSGGRDER